MPVPKGVRVGGRQKGTPNKRTAAVKQAGAEAIEKLTDAIDGAFDGDAHALMVLVYKDPTQPMPLRLDAAKGAIRYEKPALATIDLGNKDDKAFAMEARWAQSASEATPDPSEQ